MELRDWVERLQRRFDHLDHHFIPACWWRRNEHVEALVALRDHERVSFSEIAPATAPLDWFRALRDITTLLGAWTADQACDTIHQRPTARLRSQHRDGWDEHVAADIAQGEQAVIDDSL